MLFCPKCGSLLIPKKEKNKTIMMCSCGYKSKEADSARISEKVEKKKKVEVVDKDVEVLPLVDEECPKCGHKKARFWTMQTRAGDEAETKFFRCEKCKHTWREYR
ncbi:transcription factor S [Candidatus Woesearchaeota archaeon]|nr:transcription factor S [Candidatus Woesearchaeota archaeon]MBW3021635.1 transcription factor S [Candidatus Woesearchaeota archaeon]